MADHEPCHELVQRTGAPDAACVERAAPHVAHELFLLRHCLVDQGKRTGRTLWFITARALMDFFFVYERRRDKRKRYSDHILAADFLPTGAWKPRAQEYAEAAEPPDYAACRQVANKLSAYLTYSRLALVANGPSAAVHDYLMGIMGMWLDALTPERRAWFNPWFPQHA